MSRLLLLATIPLAACTNTPSHIPSPLLLPGYAVSAAADNAAYGARRLPVQSFVRANHAALVQEITAGGGVRLNQAMMLAGVPAARQPALVQTLRRDLGLYLGDPEALVVALMVHGG